MSAPPFSKVLVANRGEIACRIIRTCKKMGVATVAVCSEVDANARHVALADESVVIGGPRAADSYLNIEAVIRAAKETGSAAIHPGYGFLSENAGFAEACAAAGVRFIGPSAEAIRAMSYKGAARRIAQACAVPLLPGYDGDDQDEALLLAEAGRIGWPVMIKAVAGGGGKGMRRVDDVAQFSRALAAVRREAMSAFGNDKVMIEKFLVEPRHIEIQILGDGKGRTLALFERDCSIQRKHQKVIEETPAPGLPEAMRRQMMASAVRLADNVGYEGAGTVEFVVDASGDLSEDRYYFLEMNTRLQVEHPVTEMVTGLDLVEWQLRIAAGEPLTMTQDDVTSRGHAIEVRICAEDPDRMFLPSPGELTAFDLGLEDYGVRIETGVRAGDAVTPYYDSLLAKLVVHAPDRAAAIALMSRRLAGIEIAGIKTNLGLLQRLCKHDQFAAGNVATTFIERFSADLLTTPARAAQGHSERV